MFSSYSSSMVFPSSHFPNLFWFDFSTETRVKEGLPPSMNGKVWISVLPAHNQSHIHWVSLSTCHLISFPHYQMMFMLTF